jgi:hypothetical protein
VLQHGARQILGQALEVPTRFNVSGQQTEERADGGVLVLGIDTGNDDFAAPQVERELAASIDAELVQAVPASEAHRHAYPGGMLDHGLEIVAYSLKLRQPHLLPTGASPEGQAAQSEAWTAAVAYAALLHDIGKVAVDLHVGLANGSIWHPWHGTAEALRLGTCFGQQLDTVRGRTAAVEHPPEHPSGVVGALVGPLRVLVVNPGEDDHPGLRMEPKEQPVLLEEPVPEPVLVLVSEWAARLI